MAAPEWLAFAKHETDPVIGDTFLISKVRELYTVEPLPGGFFVCREGDLSVEFAVLEDSGGEIEKDGTVLTEGACLFHGEGPSGNLRECRHTFWGERDNAGYIFYPNGRLITAAFKRLADFFDDMV